MGTMICLALGKLEVDWGKNNFFFDHGALFQPSDLKQISTYDEDEEAPEGEPLFSMDQGFGKPLRHVRDRQGPMGYTLLAVGLTACLRIRPRTSEAAHRRCAAARSWRLPGWRLNRTRGCCRPRRH